MSFNTNSLFSTTQPAKPFIKWAGGKRQLLPQIESYLPDFVRSKVDTYIEPFLGGGAVFFYLKPKNIFKEYYLADINAELINAYTVVQKNVKDLEGELLSIQEEYFNLEEEERRTFFNNIRDEYNKFNKSDIRRAALFITINRTCFNGLYRVNSKGLFNVPFGKYKSPKILDSINLRAVSTNLEGVKILHQDYSETIKLASETAFIYADPPYRPLNATSNFAAYSKTSFNDQSQINLAKLLSGASGKNAKFMLSNSDPHNTNPSDNFFQDLYSAFNIYKIHANRMINSVANKRGKLNELLITNY